MLYSIFTRKVSQSITSYVKSSISKTTESGSIFDERLTENGNTNENTILNNIKMDDEKYVTYYIHEMKETDTIDTLCVKYNTQKSTLEKYNDINNLTSGDKIIIPLIDE